MLIKSIVLGAATLTSSAAFSQNSSNVDVLAGSKSNKVYQGYPTLLQLYSVDESKNYLIETNNGQIESTEFSVHYTPDSVGKATVFIKKVSPSGDTILLKEYRLNVAPSPKPTLFLNRQTSGTISRRVLAASEGFTSHVVIPGADVDVRLKINKYNFTIINQNRIVSALEGSSNYFNNQIKSALQKIKIGDLILITNIEIESLNDAKTHKLDPMIFSVGE